MDGWMGKGGGGMGYQIGWVFFGLLVVDLKGI